MAELNFTNEPRLSVTPTHGCMRSPLPKAQLTISGYLSDASCNVSNATGLILDSSEKRGCDAVYGIYLMSKLALTQVELAFEKPLDSKENEDAAATLYHLIALIEKVNDDGMDDRLLYGAVTLLQVAQAQLEKQD